jgi:hypothetical protein
MFGTSLARKVVVFCAALAGAATLFANGSDGEAQSTKEKRFRAVGKGASMTVAPTVTAGKPIAKVGEAVAMTLERGGMSNLETSAVAFTPPKDADLDGAAIAFAAFVKNNPPATEYILFTEILATPDRKVREVRAVIATKQGEIVWKDRQAQGDKQFDRIKPREPIQCCMLFAERLRPVLGLSDPARGPAEGGKIAARWRRESGIPDKVEREAIEARGKAFRKNAANATLLVYPVRAEGAFSAESASNVAATALKQKLANAKFAADGPRIEPAGDVNEQKMLWATARSLSEYVQKNPPEADYVLYADYLIGKGGVFALHFAICNRNGDLVAVEHQNRNTSEFKLINPSNRERCDRLLVKRLEGISR